MNENKPRSLVPFGIILGLSLMLTAVIVSWVVYYVKTYNNAVVTVTGVSQKTVKSDVVKWRGTFLRHTGPAESDLKTGSAQMTSDLNTILAYFTSNGIATSSITVNPLSVDPQYQTANGVMSAKFYGGGLGGTLTGYDLSQSILVESDNVDGLTTLAHDAPQFLVGKGIIFSAQSPEYYLKNETLDSLRRGMLQSALSDARDRAKAITEGVGATVGNLRSSSIGVTQITPVNSTLVSDYGAYDTSSVEKLLTYLVHATFALR